MRTEEDERSYYRLAVPKSETLAKLAGSDEELEKIHLQFENLELALRKGIPSRRWMVRYAPITDEIIFERIFERPQVERIVELQTTVLRDNVAFLLYSLTGGQFEEFVVDLFSKVPWVSKIAGTQLSRDGGVDFTGEFGHEKAKLTMPLLGQVKRLQAPATSPQLSEFIGSVTRRVRGNVTGVYVSLGGFTDDARRAIAESPFNILTFDLDGTLELMMAHDVGVRAQSINITSPDSVYWRERFGRQT